MWPFKECLDSVNVSENVKTSKNFHTMLDVSRGNMFFSDLISALPYLLAILFFGLRSLRCNKQ